MLFKGDDLEKEPEPDVKQDKKVRLLITFGSHLLVCVSDSLILKYPNFLFYISTRMKVLKRSGIMKALQNSKCPEFGLQIFHYQGTALVVDFNAAVGNFLMVYDRTQSKLHYLQRANERLKKARVLQARPDAEKAARTQELHKKLRVSYFVPQLCLMHCQLCIPQC